MIGDRERRLCDSCGLGLKTEKDPLQYLPTVVIGTSVSQASEEVLKTPCSFTDKLWLVAGI